MYIRLTFITILSWILNPQLNSWRITFFELNDVFEKFISLLSYWENQGSTSEILKEVKRPKSPTRRHSTVNPPLEIELSVIIQAFATTNFCFVVMKSGFQLAVFAAALARNTNLAENIEQPATVVIAPPSEFFAIQT